MTNTTQRNSIENFLYDTSNSHARESLVNNKLLFDLKLAAADRGYFLNAYLPEVDQDGFDIIFDDQEVISKIQLKTVMKGAGTSNWSIHKRLLRPVPHQCENFGFEPSPTGEGFGGGVILIQIDAESEFTIKYFYADVITLCGFRDNLLRVSRPPRQDVVQKFFQKLSSGAGSEKIVLSKSLFLEAKTPEALLAFMGLHNNLSTAIWRLHLMNIISPSLPEDQLPAPLEILKESINDELVELSPRIRRTP